MPLYESVFIARQDITPAQVDTLADEFTAIITQGGGQVAKREYWGLRNLHFRINKNRKGHYVLFNIDAPAPAIHEMERIMRINEDVMRYMTVRVEELEEGPSAVVLQKNERSERPERGGPRTGGFREGGPRGGGFRDGGPREGGRDGGFREGGPRGGRDRFDRNEGGN